MGQRTIDMELDDGATVGDAVAEVVRRYPAFSPDPARVVVAVNREYVNHNHPLANGDEAAFIPPVSGG
ncbi:MAG: MoaD/ThiS family protein [Chloroflexi bacterium]|nr:MoaD/ThiS family protein [Chloroflexota bacterium]